MERRSWPWKKKSSEKTAVTTDSANFPLSGSCGNQAAQDRPKTVKHIQISVESYAHLTELEDEVKILNEKLSSAQTEMTNKDILVKQHAKVAEEAVSGWEKAEAEALALKQQLESVTLERLTAEEKSCHLDGALKECMKQVRNLKEEGEQRLHDVVFAKTKQMEKVRAEFESKIFDFEQELLRSSAENSALTRSLQEHTNMLIKISEDKSQLETDIEILKDNLQSCEKEASSLKYELHIVSKELEIRNEEKNMSIRSAEAANKQHVEDVKKITKLESECQRLRVLVRKKLPGPAALAQMKLEVENLGLDCGENKFRQSRAKNSSTRLLPVPNYTFEHIQQFQKENEFLTTRLLSMEEETKMLKEALSKRNYELQASRNVCAKTTNMLHNLEANMLVRNQQSGPSRSNIGIVFDGSLSRHESNPPSLTSVSEDGIDEEGSCADSSATTLIPEFPQLRRDKLDKYNKVTNSNHLELMDDFLEMERFACLSTKSNVTTSPSNDVMVNVDTENDNDILTGEAQKDLGKKDQKDMDKLIDLISSVNTHYAQETESEITGIQLIKLQSRMSLFQSQCSATDMMKLLEDIKHILQDNVDELHPNADNCAGVKCLSIDGQKHCIDLTCENKNDSPIMVHSTSFTSDKAPEEQDYKDAVSQVHVFVVSLKKAIENQSRSFDDPNLSKKVEDFSASVRDALSGRKSSKDFIMSLSDTLPILMELISNVFHGNTNESGSNGSDCIDKATLLEKKVGQLVSMKEVLPGTDTIASQSASDPEADQPLDLGYELVMAMTKVSLEDFEQLKLQKENSEMELVKCTEALEHSKLKLVETGRQLEDLKLLLISGQKSNILADTQLKCMTESYRTLEVHKDELENEISMLKAKVDLLENELQEEKLNHSNDLERYNDLLAHVERKEDSGCSVLFDETDEKTKQEREIAAAAEKLAECQETILLLSKQLHSLRPPTEVIGSSPKYRNRLSDDFLEDASQNGRNTMRIELSHQLDLAEMENPSSARHGVEESPSDAWNSLMSPTDTESSNYQKSPISAKHHKHGSRSPSSSLSHGHGFSRFFSKGKVDH